MLSRLTSGKSIGQIGKRLHAGAVKRIQDYFRFSILLKQSFPVPLDKGNAGSGGDIG